MLAEPEMCGIRQICIFSMMQLKRRAFQMTECLRGNFICDLYFIRDETAFSDHTPDGKLFVTQYGVTGQF